MNSDDIKRDMEMEGEPIRPTMPESMWAWSYYKHTPSGFQELILSWTHNPKVAGPDAAEYTRRDVSDARITELKDEIRDWQLRATERERKAVLRGAELEAQLATARNDALEEFFKGASGQVEAGDGWWSPCSGCHETNEGCETGDYPYSPQFKCCQGAGCAECGGLGVIWNHAWTDEDVRRALRDQDDGRHSCGRCGEAVCEDDMDYEGNCPSCHGEMHDKWPADTIRALKTGDSE